MSHLSAMYHRVERVEISPTTTLTLSDGETVPLRTIVVTDDKGATLTLNLIGVTHTALEINPLVR